MVIEGYVQVTSLNEGLKPTEIELYNTKLKSNANPSLYVRNYANFPNPKKTALMASRPQILILQFFIFHVFLLFSFPFFSIFPSFLFILYSTTFDNIYEFVIGIFHSIQIPPMMHSYPPLQYYDFDFFSVCCFAFPRFIYICQQK